MENYGAWRRLSIKTFVREHNVGLIKEAVLRETLRGGQVYYLYNEVKTIWPHASEEILQAWLTNTEAPGFFDRSGFIQGGEAPGDQFLPLVERILGLSPYNPKAIANLEISFN